MNGRWHEKLRCMGKYGYGHGYGHGCMGGARVSVFREVRYGVDNNNEYIG